MNDIEFNLISSNKQYNLYKNNYYELKIEKDTNRISYIRPLLLGRMLPDIHIQYNIITCKFENIKIQTVSYYSLSKEEVREMINGYNIAINTIEEIERMFLNIE